MFLLNSLKSTDIIFFIICIAVVAIIVLIYFLIPIIRKKDFEERRESLRQREEAFKAGKAKLQAAAPIEETENIEESETKE